MDIKSFKGLNNVSDPMRLDMSWLVQADNINITDTGGIAKRSGYALTHPGEFLSVYATQDFQRMYLAAPNEVRDIHGNHIAPLTSGAPTYWCEVNGQVFYNNGVDSGVIMLDGKMIPWRWAAPPAPTLTAGSGTLPAGTYQVACTYVLDDGRETGANEAVAIDLPEGRALQIHITPAQGMRVNTYIAPANSDVFQLCAAKAGDSMVFNTSPDDLGRDMLNAFLDPLPIGTDVIQAWRGRIYAAMYMPGQNQTAVWYSEALGFHLFNMNSSFLLIPGRVLMLAPHDDALIIGTDARVFAYTGEKLEQLADYGVVPGSHWARDDERILFWSLRGLCAALPFANLTEKQVSVAPGVRAGGCLIRAGGQKRFVAVIQRGGEVFNARS